MHEKRQANMPIPNMQDVTLEDFWAWAYSDILSNTVRGVYGEFLVASAIGAVKDLTSRDNVRNPWWWYDLSYRETKLEVKTSAYRQTWKQKKNSSISFDIKAKKANSSRTADIYIFCIFTEKDDELAYQRVIDPNYWEFYIIPEPLLPNQKTISLRPLKALCQNNNLPYPITYDEIISVLDTMIV